MASTSGSKRPLGPPSPPTPPPHRLRQEEHVDADKPPSRKGKEVPADDDDPPPETSKEALRRRLDPPRVDEHAISRLNCLLLQVSDDHHESLPNLSEIVARIFQTEGWHQLRWNLLQAIHTDFETRQETALRVLLCLPEKQACEFFKDNYSSLHVRFLDLFDSPNVNIQALTFDASSKLISLKTLFSLDGDSEYLLLKMFVWLLIAFLNGGEIDLLEPRMMDLVAFARDNAHHVGESLHSVLTCMFVIVESADDNFIACKAIEIINILQDQNLKQKLNGVTQFIRELSEESKSKILEKCMRLMFRVEDVPSWYDMDAESSEHMGLLGTYQQAKFLLEVSLDSDEELLLPFGTEMIPQYLNSEDWKTRHAGLIAFSLIAKACSPERIPEQTERVVDISLDDPHPRVRWAAIQVILSSLSDHPKEHVQYLMKFLPRLVTIIRSSASIYPRVQFDATIAVRLLMNKCNNEEVIRSFSEDLVPELLKSLEQQGGLFRVDAMEILRSLAVSFPVVFRSHYKETVDSLNSHVSQWLLGAKSIECLSYVFSWFLRDQSLFVLSDAEKVLTIVFKILDDWKSINNKVKIYILRALSQLCKLPQTDELLNKTMPVLIQILKKTKDSTMTTLTIEKKKIPPLQIRIWACDLLSNFAVRLQKQFALWTSRVAPILTSPFRNTDDNTFDAAAVKMVNALPNVLLSCQHKKEYEELINSTVRALVQASQKETERVVDTEILKSLNACIAISGSVFNVDVIKQIAVTINQQLSQGTIYWPFNLDHNVYEMEQQEEIIQAATKCLETMINTLKSAFLPHVDELLPAVQTLWSHDTWCPYKLKEVAISIFNLLLKDCPYKLRRYRDTYLQVVMDLCHSESLELQREAARGIGLCATNTQLISNFDALKAINSLYHVIGCALESERRMTYDVAVSALGKICEFRHDIINGPQVIPIWINFLPLRNDFEEAKYAHQQLCRMLETADPDILELDNKNLEMLITEILIKILLQSDYIATEETICSIISLLTQVGAMT